MTITVIGHLCFDLLTDRDGNVARSPGGIIYSTLALANLLQPNDIIYPVFGVGKNDYDVVFSLLSQYPNISTDGVFKFSGPTNEVSLFYLDDGRRVEQSLNISEPIPYKKIRPHTKSDIILVNMISGSDISLESLDEIRMDVREQHTPVYFDLHSLSLGIDDKSFRVRRPLETWRRWLFWVHAVQMNEEEASHLTPEHHSEIMLAKHVLALNTGTLIITRGEKGYSAFIDHHKQIERIDGAGISQSTPLDPTGCGDVFAAAYCAHFGTSKNIAEALGFANTVAALNAELRGSGELDKLSTFRIISKESLQR